MLDLLRVGRATGGSLEAGILPPERAERDPGAARMLETAGELR
jgi:hypothetical protein